ncbi:MAG: hypothetical protein JNK05_29205 [Myxococcales bacterium]|nr:hypothetical protein [Myxococcales bacterium]
MRLRLCAAFVCCLGLLVARAVDARCVDIRADSTLLDAVFTRAVQQHRVSSCDASDAAAAPIIVHMNFPSLSAAVATDDTNPAESLAFELAVEEDRVARLVGDTPAVLRAQCPVVPSWAAIEQRVSIARAVACRVLYGEPTRVVAERASRVLAGRGRAVSAAVIARDLARIPVVARLSTAMIVPMSQWSGGAPFQPIRFDSPEPTAPHAGQRPAQCRSFRARWPISSSARGSNGELVSQQPMWDSSDALSRCWGPRGEWALGVGDRSYLIQLGAGGSQQMQRLFATLAHWDPRGRRVETRIDDSMNEHFEMHAAIDLDGDGSTEAVVSHLSYLGARLAIYTARDGHIDRWSDGPSNVARIVDEDHDGVSELLALYPVRRFAGDDPHEASAMLSLAQREHRRRSCRAAPQNSAQTNNAECRDDESQSSATETPFLELWQRVSSGRFSNRTPLSASFAARQCPAIPRVMFTDPETPLWQLIGNVRCARMRGLSAEETVFRLCAPEARLCDQPIGQAAVRAAREDILFLLQ